MQSLCENPVNSFVVISPISFQAAFHTYSGIDIDNQFVVKSDMAIFQRTGRYILFVSVFMLVLQVTAVTAQNKKAGVTVSYESSGSSRVARFKNANPYHVRVEFSYSGTRVHGSAEASGQDAVLYQPIIPLHMVGRGFLSPQSASLVLCGRTKIANAITVVSGEKSGGSDAVRPAWGKNWRSDPSLPTESFLSDPSEGLIADDF